MPKSRKAGLVDWTFRDWRRKPTAEQRRNQLLLHMEEVEGFIFESENNDQKLRLQNNYLPYLQEQLDRLELQTGASSDSRLNRLGKTSKFVRGGDT